ncbi:morphogenic membrane protein MmpA [Streptomyces sp. NPDC002309]
MTTHRGPEPAARPSRPLAAALACAVPAGLAWLGAMIWTLARWTM